MSRLHDASLIELVLIQVVLAAIMYLVLAGLSHRWFFVHRRARYFPDEGPGGRVDKRRDREAMRTSLLGICGNATLGAPLFWLALHGHSQLYARVDEYGWPYLLLSVGLCLAFTETCVYWAHRALHHPWLYRRFHRQHHSWRRPTPWVSLAFHPLDSFLQGLPHHLCIFLLPVHVGVYLGFLALVAVWTFLIHDRVSFTTHRAINYTAHHTLHHLYNHGNYGQFLTVWDRLAGTYRDPLREQRYAAELVWHDRTPTGGPPP